MHCALAGLVDLTWYCETPLLRIVLTELYVVVWESRASDYCTVVRTRSPLILGGIIRGQIRNLLNLTEG